MFVKLFRSIFDGSLGDDPETRHIFMDLLALADSKGELDMTPEAIAAITRLPLERVNAALTELGSPDPRSRIPDEEGRRIVPLHEGREWGWRIVNYMRYRMTRNQEDRRQQNREAQARRREREAKQAPVSRRQPLSAAVSRSKPKQKQKQKQNKRRSRSLKRGRRG